MAVWAIGLNHNTAPLDMRGKFAFAVDQIGPTLSGLRSAFSDQSEAAILSTCNRTEIYCAGPKTALEQTLHWLAQSGGRPAKESNSGCSSKGRSSTANSLATMVKSLPLAARMASSPR